MRTSVFFGSCMAMAGMLLPIGALATTTSCNIPAACAVFANNTGIALEGESAGGDGVLGEASSGTIYGAGLEGESLKQTGADAAGTFGLTLLSNGVAPNYGVVSYGSLYGLYGQAGNTGLSSSGPGFGVFGQDNAGSKNADYNVGVTGLSLNNVGVLAEGSGAPSAFFYGKDGIPIGLYAVGNKTNGNPFGQALGAVVESDWEDEVMLNTSDSGRADFLSTTNLISASDSATGGGGSFAISNQGDMSLSGTLTTSKGGPYLKTTGASGRAVTAYSDHMTTPEMEDVGEGQLVNGRALVKIDAALADVIDLRTGYHVFITPEGESNGLYIVKGADGFVVREQHGGHSTIAFEYRIVAKPREENGVRLARVVASPDRVAVGAAASGRPQQIPLPLSPEDRLKRKIGMKAYAEMMTKLANRLSPSSAR